MNRRSSAHITTCSTARFLPLRRQLYFMAHAESAEGARATASILSTATGYRCYHGRPGRQAQLLKGDMRHHASLVSARALCA